MLAQVSRRHLLAAARFPVTNKSSSLGVAVFKAFQRREQLVYPEMTGRFTSSFGLLN